MTNKVLDIPLDNGNVEVTIFGAPSGNVRGTIVATLNERRVAQAYLFTDKDPEITLDKVNLRGVKSLIHAVRSLTTVLSAFADEVTRNRA